VRPQGPGNPGRPAARGNTLSDSTADIANQAFGAAALTEQLAAMFPRHSSGPASGGSQPQVMNGEHTWQTAHLLEPTAVQASCRGPVGMPGGDRLLSAPAHAAPARRPAASPHQCNHRRDHSELGWASDVERTDGTEPQAFSCCHHQWSTSPPADRSPVRVQPLTWEPPYGIEP